MARLAGPEQHPKRQSLFRSIRPCLSIAYAVRVSPCLRSGDRKLQECIGYNSKNLTELEGMPLHPEPLGLTPSHPANPAHLVNPASDNRITRRLQRLPQPRKNPLDISPQLR